MLLFQLNVGKKYHNISYIVIEINLKVYKITF